jgi:hypothetical protein
MKQLGKLQTGEKVVDRFESHIHPGVTAEILEAALKQIHSQDKDRIKVTIDFRETIGHTHRVRTGPEDEIIYAQRCGRKGVTRFVKNRQPEPTSCLTIKLHRKKDKTYELRTAYLGEAGKTEPWAARLKEDAELLEKAYDFWNEHALCWGTEKVIPGTETSNSDSF